MERRQYRVCPLCNASLDPQESCDCQEEIKNQERKEKINNEKIYKSN